MSSGVVLSQVPASGSKVKSGRTIYLTLSVKNPPKVKIPRLIDKNLAAAINELRQADLKLGNVIYEKGEFEDLVIRQLTGSPESEPMDSVVKGTAIHLVISTRK